MPNTGIAFTRYLLMPIAWLYGIGVRLRNWLFDRQVLPSERFDLPIICIGNLAVGGTGKTPHTEYLIRLIKKQYRVAVLSRGYKRKTKGFRLATLTSNSLEIGDEPYQIKQKFPDITVAVDSDRRRGIRQLLTLPSSQKPEVILLDDAFQHRYVRPSLSLLLTDINRLYAKDTLLPAGRLREPAIGAKRADLILVTKCESSITPAHAKTIEQQLQPQDKKIYFSHIRYEELIPVFPEKARKLNLSDFHPDTPVFLVVGIASPQPFIQEIQRHTQQVVTFEFPDHHNFTKQDILRIHAAFMRQNSPKKVIIVTEKDAARLRNLPILPSEWHNFLYCLPITIGFCLEKEQDFQEQILKHIQSYEQKNRNCSLR